MYIVGAWVVLQVADLAFPGLAIPDSAIRYVWIASILLFPLVLIFGWRFDLTAHGLLRTPPADRGMEDGYSPNGTDYVLIALVSLSAVTIAFTLFVNLLDTREPALPAAKIEEIVARSIAVLPFVDMSQAGDQQYFSDGIAEEILNDLSR
jgi:hypothetical protein